MIMVVCGVSGCGKSTVEKLLADKFGRIFHDADDFHAEDSIEKMRHGIGYHRQSPGYVSEHHRAGQPKKGLASGYIATNQTMAPDK